ncbi:cytochrome c3 family protein [Desulfobacula sp.]|uniref:cytochrome c3 family protein n=1 Tax=Desulfobacula sp. TaxID=2593537 RepID=UPI0039B865D0
MLKPCLKNCQDNYRTIFLEGALTKSKKTGVLKKKQVMNKTCLKCHRNNKKTGKAYGPVKCSGCHIK